MNIADWTSIEFSRDAEIGEQAHHDPSERNGIYTQIAHARSSYGRSRQLWRTLQSVREILRKWSESK